MAVFNGANRNQLDQGLLFFVANYGPRKRVFSNEP